MRGKKKRERVMIWEEGGIGMEGKGRNWWRHREEGKGMEHENKEGQRVASMAG